NRCGCSHHFTEVKQCLHQCRWVRIDLFSEIRPGCAATQTDGSALAIWQAHATNYVWCASLVVVIALLTARLLTASWCAAWTAECTCSTAATSAASTWTTTESTWCSTWLSAAWTVAWATTATASTGSSCLLRHSCWVWMRRHHCWRWTTSAALTTRLWLILAVIWTTAVTLSTLWLQAWSLSSTWAWCRTIACATTGRKWVISHATRTAWFRHGTWGWLVATFCTWLRSARLWSSRLGRTRFWSAWLWGTRFCSCWSRRLFGSRCRSWRGLCRCWLLGWFRRAWLRSSRFWCTWFCSAWLRSTWFRCAWLGSSRFWCTWFCCSLLWLSLCWRSLSCGLGVVATDALLFIMRTHLFHHRRFDGG